MYVLHNHTESMMNVCTSGENDYNLTLAQLKIKMYMITGIV